MVPPEPALPPAEVVGLKARSRKTARGTGRARTAGLSRVSRTGLELARPRGPL